MYNAVKADNIARAMELQNIFLAFVEIWHKYGYRALFEYLMRRKGYGGGIDRMSTYLANTLCAEDTR